MTMPQATAHGMERERKGERARNKGNKKRERVAREAHRRACFIKVQVQDLSDCQRALSFWFHINAVSFLPRLASPHLHWSIPHHVLLFTLFPSAPLAPRQRKVWLRRSTSQSYFCILKIWIETTPQFLSNQSCHSNIHFSTTPADKMLLISGESAKGGALTSSIIMHLCDMPTAQTRRSVSESDMAYHDDETDRS